MMLEMITNKAARRNTENSITLGMVTLYKAKHASSVSKSCSTLLPVQLHAIKKLQNLQQQQEQQAIPPSTSIVKKHQRHNKTEWAKGGTNAAEKKQQQSKEVKIVIDLS